MVRGVGRIRWRELMKSRQRLNGTSRLLCFISVLCIVAFVVVGVDVDVDVDADVDAYVVVTCALCPNRKSKSKSKNSEAQRAVI